jgi:hypothetical protein
VSYPNSHIFKIFEREKWGGRGGGIAAERKRREREREMKSKKEER